MSQKAVAALCSYFPASLKGIGRGEHNDSKGEDDGEASTAQGGAAV